MKQPLFVLASALVLALSVTPIMAAEMQIYAVTKVATGGALNMRSGPGAGNSVVVKIPADSDGIVATGEEKKVGSTTWAKVYWNGKGGWVSKSYLRPDKVTNSSPASGSGTKPPAANTGVVMKCSGTEPFWGIDITESKLNINMPDGPQYNVPVTFRQTSANNRTIAVIAGANGPNNTQVFLQKVASCSDGMSDNSYPYSATAVLNNKQVISGCCKVQ
jgi:uncharacterized membrane protein